MSRQHIQKYSTRLLYTPAKFEKNPPNGQSYKENKTRSLIFSHTQKKRLLKYFYIRYCSMSMQPNDLPTTGKYKLSGILDQTPYPPPKLDFDIVWLRNGRVIND